MSIPLIPFKREDHVYSNPAFAEFLKDAVRAFNGSPVTSLPPPSFTGSGVYALYCTASTGPYAKFGREINRLEYKTPIYVGKAVPPGWRQSRQFENVEDTSSALFTRLCEHGQDIKLAHGIALKDFHVRKMVFTATDFPIVNELHRFLVFHYKPLWNTIIRGFSELKSATDEPTSWEIFHMMKSPSVEDKQRIRSQIDDYLTKLVNSLAA